MVTFRLEALTTTAAAGADMDPVQPYIGEPQELPTPLDTLSSEMKEQLSELGRMVEGHTSLDPEFAEVEVVETSAKPSVWQQAKEYALDADMDRQITGGEIRVFAMGMFSGFIISRILR